MKKLTYKERVHRTDTERLRHMVQRRIEKWVEEEDININVDIYIKIEKTETLFPQLPFKNEDCGTFVHLLNTDKGTPSFNVFLTCRKGFIVSGALAEILAREVSVSIDHLLEEKDWLPADVS